MVSGKVIVRIPTGLHLRPAGELCKLALNFESKVSIKIRSTVANAKSVLGVLGACVKEGEEIELVCEGEDEEEALKVLLKAVEDGLGDQLPS